MKFISNKGKPLTFLLCICILSLVCSSIPVNASKVKDLEDKTDELKNELNDINQELLELSNQIADVEEEIEITNGEITRTEELLAIAKNREADQYDEMKLRIKYMYENDDVTLLEVLFQAESMQAFLNTVEFIKNVSEYDRNKLDELHELKVTIANQEQHLKEEQESQIQLQEQLDFQETTLQEKAKETSTNISELKAQIKKIREEEARKAAEAEAKRKAEEARKAAEAEAREAAKAANSKASKSSGKSAGASDPQYDLPSGPGVLTKSKGVNYYKGHRETWYSQRVLPGGGLNIPGRHVGPDGVIRDGDGYICVASSDYPKGTVVETSLGPGKVYDTGCAKGTIDIYTDW